MLNKIHHRGYSAIGLSNPKDSCNIGGALRAASCYGSSLVAISGKKYTKHSSDTCKTYRHIPLLHTDNLKNLIPYNCVPVAIEIVPGARELSKYTHPESAFYIFGPENGTLPKEILEFCRDVVYVPTNYCMNLAACVNVVLYDRMSKMFRE